MRESEPSMAQPQDEAVVQAAADVGATKAGELGLSEAECRLRHVECVLSQVASNRSQK